MQRFVSFYNDMLVFFSLFLSSEQHVAHLRPLPRRLGRGDLSKIKIENVKTYRLSVVLTRYTRVRPRRENSRE